MPKIIRAIKPNAGIRAKYRKRLVSLLDEMQRSVVWWLRAEYRKQETRIAQDSPASDLQDRLKRLFRYWTRRWKESAESFAREFVGSTRRRTEASMRQALKNAGFTVKMKASTRAMNDVERALLLENYNIIKSIPQQYITDVTGLVMRSASMGRDVAFLTDELHKRYEITRRRAEFIARDQSKTD